MQYSYIAQELKLLVSAWPNTAKADLAGFGALLSMDVRSRAPSRYAISAAARKLRQTHKFLPSISEVLEEIDAAEIRIQQLDKYVGQLPKRIERANADLLEYDRRYAREEAFEAKRREQDEADRQRRLAEGKATDW